MAMAFGRPRAPENRERIETASERGALKNYESGGQEFESLRARQLTKSMTYGPI